MDDSREDLEQALLPGEHLLWSGRPDPKVIFGPVDALLIPFGLVFTGFAAAWMLIAISIGHNPEFALFGVPILLFGFYYLFGRFFVKVARKNEPATGSPIDVRSW